MPKVEEMSNDDLLYWLSNPLTDDINFNESVKAEVNKRGLRPINA